MAAPVGAGGCRQVRLPRRTLLAVGSLAVAEQAGEAPNVGLKELGVRGTKGKYHAPLSQLAEAGLIVIERKPKKSPVVMLRFVD